MHDPPSPLPFAHLHNHSAFSFGDGSSTVAALVLRAAHTHQGSLALTDTMSVTGIPSLVRHCAKAGIQPTGGAEILLEGGDRLTLLADGPEGFASLCQILSAAGMRDVKREGPRVRWEEVHEHRAGLVCLSGSPEQGGIPRLLRRGRFPDAEAYARRLMDLFGPAGFYIEVTRSLVEGDRLVSSRLFEMADHLGVPAVATNCVHHATKMEMASHESLRRVRLGLGPFDESGELALNAERYLKTGADMAKLFPDRPDALRSAVDLAERLSPPLDPDIRHYPRFPKLPPGETAWSFLCALAWTGAEKRYKGDAFNTAVQERLIHELEVIRDLGYCDYLLVCWDICREASVRNIGHALRGSAVGSVVIYCLGMSPHDPVARNISFERFLSRARRKPPDIDIDFRHDLRDQMMEYTRQTYGPEKVANVANYVTYRGRSLLRDLGKVLGVAGGEIDRLREVLHGSSRGKDLAGELADKPELKALGIDAARYADLFALCASLSGLPRHLGTHSSGLVVSDVPLAGVAPLLWAAKGAPVVAFDKDDVESPGVGLLKIDQLSLRALTAVDIATNRIAESDPAFDYDARDRDDPETLAMIRLAKTVGVFQIESPAQMALQWRLKADSFDDLVHAVALIRPGPMMGGGVNAYLAGRNRGRSGKPLAYPLPELEAVLAETYGRIIYQDQALEVVRVVGDLSPDEADAFLKGMTHARDQDEMARFGRALGIRALSKGMSKKAFSRLWKQVQGFSRYGFCQGHALAFAAHAQGTAWLLQRYPAEFYAAVLSVEPCGFWPIHTVTGETVRRGVGVLAPDLNRSQATEWMVEEIERGGKSIRCSLSFVQSIGERAAEAIVRERESNGPFRDLADAGARLWFLSRDRMEWLALSGALDALCPSRRQALWSLPALHHPGKDSVRKLREAEAAAGLQQASFVDMPVPPLLPASVADFRFREKFWRQWEALGFSPEGHPMQFWRRRLDADGVLPCAALQEAKDGQAVRVAGLLVCPHRPPMPSGETYVFFTLEDETGLAQVTVTPTVYQRTGAAIFGNVSLIVTGIAERRGAGLSLRAEQVAALTSG